MLRIENLSLSIRGATGSKQVLSDVNLSVAPGEILGLVGESGSGKSLTGLSIARMVPRGSFYDSGRILFEGVDLLHRSEAEMRALRGTSVGMIFQDPTTNLNPLFSVGTQLTDAALAAARWKPEILGVPASASRRQKKRAARDLAAQMLERVSISSARLDDYPFQFSGGMKQRVLIAMAIVGRPRLLISDEATTALDVSVQAQILQLIYDLVEEFGLAVIFITHSLGVVAELCSHVAVMYRGNIVESGDVRSVLLNPSHRYTKALLQSVPHLDTPRGSLRSLDGRGIEEQARALADRKRA